MEWSGQRASNSRHSAWGADVLPTELCPHQDLADTGKAGEAALPLRASSFVPLQIVKESSVIPDFPEPALTMLPSGTSCYLPIPHASRVIRIKRVTASSSFTSKSPGQTKKPGVLSEHPGFWPDRLVCRLSVTLLLRPGENPCGCCYHYLPTNNPADHCRSRTRRVEW